jgi:hypothetical protein
VSQDKRHPKSTYDAKYPYNRIEVTESGHEIHYDDTPGKERIRESHMSGTYREISKDGKLVTVSVGNRVDYNKEGLTVTTDKNVDSKVGGASRTSIGGSQHSEVKGDATSAVDGDSKMMVGGDAVSAVKGDMVTGVKGATKMRLGGGVEIKGDQKINSKIDAEASFEFGDTLEISAIKSITLKVGGSHIVITPDHITIKASTIYFEAEGDANFKASNLKLGGGGTVQVNSGANLVDPPWTSGAEPPEPAPD